MEGNGEYLPLAIGGDAHQFRVAAALRDDIEA